MTDQAIIATLEKENEWLTARLAESYKDHATVSALLSKSLTVIEHLLIHKAHSSPFKCGSAAGGESPAHSGGEG